MSIIYKIYNDIDTMIYIGSTDDYNRRKNEHFNLLRKNNHHCLLLQLAYNNLEEATWNIKIIEEVNNELRWIKEQNYINRSINTIYNTELIVNERSEETKALVSDKLRTFSLGELKSVLTKLISNPNLSVTEACYDTNLNINKLYYTINKGTNKSILDKESLALIAEYKSIPRLHKPLNGGLFFKDPNGSIHEVTKSMLSFCKKHKLNNSNMCQVKRGLRKSCQGWTLSTTEKSN